MRKEEKKAGSLPPLNKQDFNKIFFRLGFLICDLHYIH
jgi:hypothetical protein